MKVRFLILLVGLAAVSRLLPHPLNFTSIGAMGLFGAAFFDKKWMGLVVPFLSLFLTDLFVNNVIYGSFYGHFVWFTTSAWTIYLGFAAYFLIGLVAFSERVSAKNVVVSAALGSVIFFLLTNFGAWQTSPIYSQTPAGLMTAYVAGLPYFANTLAGDLCFSGVLFGAFSFLKKKVPALAVA